MSGISTQHALLTAEIACYACCDQNWLCASLTSPHHFICSCSCVAYVARVHLTACSYEFPALRKAKVAVVNDLCMQLAVPCRYRIREDLAYQNLKDLSLRVQPHDEISAAGTVNIFNSNMDDTLTWDFVTWVKTVTKIPLFVKVHLPALLNEPTVAASCCF